MASRLQSSSQKSQKNRSISDLEINKEKFNIFRLSTSIHSPNELVLHLQTRNGLLQIRSGDEAFSVFHVCMKCNYTKRHD